MRLIPIIILVGIIASFIFIFGIKSDISAGDEPYHYLLVKTIYETKSRPLYEELVNSNHLAKRYYTLGVLWHSLLVFIWYMTGGISQNTAQLYQVSYYILLIIFTYFLAKNLYSKEVALYSSLLVATMPMSVVFSMMVYIDIPVAALSTLCLLLIVKKKNFLAGLIAGLTCLMKLNGFFLIPALILLVFFTNKVDLKNRIRNEIIFLIPLIIFILPDIIYRYHNFGKFAFGFTTSTIKPIYPVLFCSFIHPEDIIRNPLNLIKEFGIPVLIFLIIYLRYINRYFKKDLFLWLPILNYLIFFFIVFQTGYGARYLSPIIAFISIISASTLLRTNPLIEKFESKLKPFFNRTIFMTLVIGISLIQTFSALFYTYNYRKITPSRWKAYNYVKDHIPIESRLLAVRPYYLSIYTGRKSMWNSEASMLEIGYMFWLAKNEEILDILGRYKIDYIFVEKDRIYDDTHGLRHITDFPKSFVNKLPNLSFLESVFENKAVHIWKVNR